MLKRLLQFILSAGLAVAWMEAGIASEAQANSPEPRTPATESAVVAASPEGESPVAKSPLSESAALAATAPEPKNLPGETVDIDPPGSVRIVGCPKKFPALAPPRWRDGDPR